MRRPLSVPTSGGLVELSQHRADLLVADPAGARRAPSPRSPKLFAFRRTETLKMASCTTGPETKRYDRSTFACSLLVNSRLLANSHRSSVVVVV
jgi:hypothetical protein